MERERDRDRLVPPGDPSGDPRAWAAPDASGPAGPAPDASGPAGPAPDASGPAGPASDASAAVGQAPEDAPQLPEVAPPADGPPPPPFARTRQRRRRRLALVGIAVAAVIVVPVALAAAGGQFGGAAEDPSGGVAAGPDEDASDGGAAGESGPQGPSGDGAPDEDALDDGTPDDEVPAVDLAELSGTDALYGALLTDVDASEQVMMGFQADVDAALEEHAGGDVEALFEDVRTAALARHGRLLEVREDLVPQLDDAGADEVRDVYLTHLDAWADYLEVIGEDPTTLAREEESFGYDLAINASADAFARSLEERLPDDADPQVAALAEAILDRGFRGVDSDI